jgi:nucleoside-diphosphate-sugar epimerase
MGSRLAALHGSARTGAVCYPGRGLNVCSSIHVDDLAHIFLLALDKGRPGALYHAVSGETNWRSIAEHIAKLRNLPTRSVSYEAALSLFGPFLAPIVFATNMRTRCPRTRSELGWEPHPERLDLFAELAHPAFMAMGKEDGDDAGFTLASALRVGRLEG